MGEDPDVTAASASERRNIRNLSVGSSLESEGSHIRRLNMPMMYQMYESQYDDLRGTIYGPESPDFHPVQASETLKKALSGMETKDQIIVNTVLHYNNFQRQKILSAYEDMYGRKLIDDLEEETGGFFLEMAQALFKPAHQYDTMNLHRSLSVESTIQEVENMEVNASVPSVSAGGEVSRKVPKEDELARTLKNRFADHSVAIEIACTRSARQLRVIRDTYLADYKKTVDKDILVKVEGVIGRMLTLLICKTRSDDARKLDQDQVNAHAQLLLKNSMEEISKNMNLFEQIFVGSSWKHLAAVFDQVDELRGGERDIETLIRKNKVLHSEIRQIFLTIVRVSRNMQLYFAEQLHAAMTRERPDHQAIIRITVSRSETDLYDIAEEYKRKYNRTIEYDLQQTCSGDYLRIVSSLLSASSNNNNHIM